MQSLYDGRMQRGTELLTGNRSWRRWRCRGKTQFSSRNPAYRRCRRHGEVATLNTGSASTKRRLRPSPPLAVLDRSTNGGSAGLWLGRMTDDQVEGRRRTKRRTIGRLSLIEDRDGQMARAATKLTEKYPLSFDQVLWQIRTFTWYHLFYYAVSKGIGIECSVLFIIFRAHILLCI